jgi:phage baseplate assembly protein gpV
MRSLVASELRIVRRQLAKANRRIALASLSGKVKPGSQDMEKRTVRLVLGVDRDGNEILSPHVRWKQQGAGRLKLHSVPADNEQMVLRSASGTVGEGSEADWSTYDDDNAAPSDKDTEAVIEFEGGTRLTIEKDTNRVSTKNLHFDADTVTLGGEGGKQVARIGDMVTVGAGSSAGQWPITSGSDVVSAI